MNIDTVTAWIASHWWPFTSAVLILILRTHTAEEWIALGEKRPRWQGVIKMLRGAGLDPRKVVEGATQVVTGRAPASALRVVEVVRTVTLRGDEHPLPRPDAPATIAPAASIGARAAADER